MERHGYLGKRTGCNGGLIIMDSSKRDRLLITDVGKWIERNIILKEIPAISRGEAKRDVCSHAIPEGTRLSRGLSCRRGYRACSSMRRILDNWKDLHKKVKMSDLQNDYSRYISLSTHKLGDATKDTYFCIHNLTFVDSGLIKWLCKYDPHMN